MAGQTSGRERGRQAALTVGSPMQVHGVLKEPARRAPGLGKHGHEILRELGFDPAEIEKLHAAGTALRG
jgi:crotonobetainyl-CoA:carnitine CoA-transferase CaiB-like acyl-CoA transferase